MGLRTRGRRTTCVRATHRGALTLAAGVSLAFPGPAESQVVRGRVSAEGIGVPLAGAAVSLLDAGGRSVAYARAEDTGRYRVTAPAAGAYVLRVDLTGYRTLTSPLLRLEAGDTLAADFEMPAEPIPIEGLRVDAERQAELRTLVARSFGVRPDDIGERFVGAEAIARRAHARDFGQVLQWQSVPSMTIRRSEDAAVGSGRPRVCVLYRSPVCAVMVLDGARVTNEAAALIPPEALDAIVLLSPVEATLLYGTDAAGGAVLLFTKAGR